MNPVPKLNVRLVKLNNRSIYLKELEEQYERKWMKNKMTVKKIVDHIPEGSDEEEPVQKYQDIPEGSEEENPVKKNDDNPEGSDEEEPVKKKARRMMVDELNSEEEY
ncbi:hypothetical protein B9Z55_021212 [Caenorhabditis nigoni]|uniref:Uncharacterized protein n=1 Tax=Caenorhabditis nigoni TaxID=1611254 RepID=A0A2G5TQX1_9PELO|nr:hypothetical protein B9Z55_021212 [Caenorhabditis nigoni]